MSGSIAPKIPGEDNGWLALAFKFSLWRRD